MNGLTELGVSSLQSRAVVEWVLLTIGRMALPTYSYKRGELQLALWPAKDCTRRMSAELDVLVDIKIIIVMLWSAEITRLEGGDTIMDRHDGLMADAMTSNGIKFEGATLIFRAIGEVSALLVGMVEETANAKAAVLAAIYKRLQVSAAPYAHTHPCTLRDC